MTERLARFAPHWLVGALCVGIGFANAGRSTWLGLPGIAVGAAFAAALGSGRGRVVLAAAAILLAGWWWGSARLEALDRSALLPEVGRAGRAILVVTGPARRTPFELRVTARVKRFLDLAADEPVLLTLPLGRAPPQGAVIDVQAEVEPPRGPEAGFDERTWLRRHGVHVVLDADRWRLVARRGGLGGFADRLRARLAQAVARGLRGERRAVLEGVVLGEDEGLSEELRDRFRASGLYHLLAVSGQNVGLVAAGALALAWLAGLPRWLGELGALAGIGGYVLAVGAQPSVVRAGIAGALASLAWLAARQRDRWYFLLLGALALLAWNPYNLLDAGFQLSFAAVAAIFTLMPRLVRLLEGYPLPKWLAQVVALSTACGLATAPILWLHFHAVPLLSVPANALAAPAAAPLLWLALAAAAVEPLAPGAAAALAWLNGWCAAYLAACARIVGGLPFAQVTSAAGLAAVAAAVGLVLVLARLPPRGRRPVLALAAVAFFLVAAWRLWPQPRLPPPTGLRISFLDVGQGDAALLQVPQGAVLVDQGPPEARVAEQLRHLGVTRLEALVLTHPSRDNIGGAQDVLRRIDVRTVFEPHLPFENPYGRPALAEARRRGVPIRIPRGGQSYRLGRLRLHVLWPSGSAQPGDDPNDHATVLLASYGAIDALLPADAESPVLAALPLRPVEILKVSHHGSADPGLPDLLRRLHPRVAVVSVGEGNDYGHPAPSTLSALARSPGLALYRTDRDGRVVVETDGKRLWVRKER